MHMGRIGLILESERALVDAAQSELSLLTAYLHDYNRLLATTSVSELQGTDFRFAIEDVICQWDDHVFEWDVEAMAADWFFFRFATQKLARRLESRLRAGLWNF